MNNDNNYTDGNNGNNLEAPVNKTSSLNNMNALSQYLKSTAATREGREIPPLDKWHPENIADMDLVIKANGEWWHEGGKMTRQSLVNLFATILWKEENDGVTEYFLKTPVQKIRIQVEDVPLLINDVGIVKENEVSWLEFVTTTGDVVRLDDEHLISLQAYQPDNAADRIDESQVRPYMPVRNGLNALIGRNTFYHLTEIGELTEHDGKTMLTLQSGGKSYSMTMPDH
ncbi:DUF1285 domain-containing protein [Psychrobacter pacificensis]|uniref:DUF1285 domain-containing protein n=1 Tax=Psychrobacter pacificensis TaxID=112002 RepID=UPI0030A13DE0